jgi:hypothetical protein
MRQCRDHGLNQVAATKLYRRQVHGHLDSGRPFCGLRAGFPQYPFAERHDQTDVFGDGNEFGRRDHAVLRMMPAQERFEAADLIRGDIHQRLIVEFELAIGEGAAQVELHVPALLCFAVHLTLEEPVEATAIRLGAIKRHVGVTHQFLAGIAIVGRQRDANAGAHDEFAAIDLVAIAQ